VNNGLIGDCEDCHDVPMLIQHLNKNAKAFSEKWALVGEDVTGVPIRLTYAMLSQQVSQCATEMLANQLHIRPNDVVATMMDNSPAWIVMDLAALQAQLTHIPLPAYFTDAQLQHAIHDAGVSILLTDQPERFLILGGEVVAKVALANRILTVLRFENMTAKQHPQVAKITYTSGTTGQPKGVCLNAQAMFHVAQSICQLVEVGQADQHVCILPLATLLENVAGVYASLLGGATVHVLSSHSVGFTGSQFNVEKLANALLRHEASTGILIPELLKALMHWVSKNIQTFPALKFLAVGGAHVAVDLLKQAQSLGLPVYEGYGLSESASVVTLNTPQANKLGSVGKPLPHIEMRLAEDGEIWIKGANYLGYTSQALQTDDDGYVATGDIGRCDGAGYLYIKGSQKKYFHYVVWSQRLTRMGREYAVESCLYCSSVRVWRGTTMECGAHRRSPRSERTRHTNGD
jgi:long-chain acyl-CoA synthetase